MAAFDNPVRPGETPPTGASSTETFPVAPQAPIDAAAIEAPGTTNTNPVGLEAIAGAASLPGAEAQGAAAEAEAQREKSGFLGTAGAAVQRWMPVDMYKRATIPDFEPGDFNVGEAVLGLNFQLSENERQFLLQNKSRSLDEHQYRLQRLEEDRKINESLGDNPVLGMLVQAVDPGWIGIDIASAGASRLVRAGWAARALTAGSVAGLSSAAINTAIKDVRPIGDTEIIADSLLNGAGAMLFIPKGSAFGRLPKPTRIDPNFPADELAAIARDTNIQVARPDVKWEPVLDDLGQPVTRNGKPVLRPTKVGEKLDTVAGARDVPPIRAETAAAPKWTVKYKAGPTPRGAVRSTVGSALDNIIMNSTDEVAKTFARNFKDRLGAAADKMPLHITDKPIRGREKVLGEYDVGGNKIVVRKGAPEGATLHEVAHAATVNKIEYGLANPKSVHGQIVKELDKLRKASYDAMNTVENKRTLAPYLSTDVHEFVAGLYTRDPAFIKALQEIPDPGNPRRNMLGRVVEAVRRLLGMGADETDGFLRALQLSDELMDQPLSVVYQRKGAGAPKRKRLDTPEAVAKATDEVLQEEVKEAAGLAPAFAGKVEWSLSKTMKGYDPEVAKILLDDPLRQNYDSADSFVRSIRSSFTTYQRVFEDTVREISAARGAGIATRVFNPGKAMKIQKQIDIELRAELDYRARYFKNNEADAPPRPGTDPAISKLADAHQKSYDVAREEMIRSGVEGADLIPDSRGYYQRKWDASTLAKWRNDLQAKFGIDEAGSRTIIVDGFRRSLKKVNPDWSDELAGDVASALVDRTIRKGDFTDTAFRGHMGNEALAEVRDSLKDAIPEARLQRVMDILTGKVDEANRPAYLKSKLDLDLDHTIKLPDGTEYRIGDMIESNLTNSMERYMDEVAGRAALARKGLSKQSDIANLKAKMVRTMQAAGKDGTEILRAGDMFDNVINMLHGRGVGTDFQIGMRYLQAGAQMMGLGASGIWQVTEYAKIMQKYGLGRTLQYMRKSANFETDIRKMSPEDLNSLNHILARNAFQDVRLRPFLEKMEDGHEFPMSNKLMHSLQQAKQLVPYLNAMKFVHHHQANLAGNLITDTLVRAAKGNGKFEAVLKQYGIDLDTPLMGQIRRDLATHGSDTAKWSDGTWDYLQTGLDRMMDDAVIRSRRGELPAFAQASDLGKFLFTFRSFILGAHNKTLGGTLNRDGMLGYTALLMYQYPLSIIAVMAHSAVKGKDLSDKEVLSGAVAQSGSIGLFSEVFAVVSGDKQSFGVPGMIGADRVYNVVSQAASLDGAGTGAALLNAIPLLPIVPFAGHLQNLIKE